MSGLWHLEVSAGLQPPQRSNWPRLQYALKGIARSQPTSACRCLSITAVNMTRLQEAIPSVPRSQYEAKLLLGGHAALYFGFMRSREFTITSQLTEPAVRLSDVAIDSHHTPTLLRVRLRRAKTDPLGQGVEIFMNKSGMSLCPVVAVLSYLAVRSGSDGPLLIHADGLPLTRDQFVTKVKRALQAAQIDSALYSGHSFHIGAASQGCRLILSRSWAGGKVKHTTSTSEPNKVPCRCVNPHRPVSHT